MSATIVRRRALGVVLMVLLPLASPAATEAVEPEWGPAQAVPPADADHALPMAAVLPDGTLVAVWESDRAAREGGASAIVRSTRPPGGDWTAPVAFPVPDAEGLDAVAAQPDGGLLVAHGSVAGETRHRVHTWNADGTVGQLGPTNAWDDYALSADAAGDVVAERLGGYDEDTGFDRLLRYFDGSSWSTMPRLGADPRDVFVPGPGESVWMAGYDQARSRLVVRRWTRGPGWSTAWARDFRPRHLRRPRVDGLDLAVGGRGRVALAFTERGHGTTGAVVRVVRRQGRRGWTRPVVLHRRDAGAPGTTSAPVVAAAGPVVEVAWTSSSDEVPNGRDVLVARLGTGPVERERLATAASFPGFRDLSLDVDVRADGHVLVTYLERRGDVRDLVGWLGPHGELLRTTLVEGSGIMRADRSFLVDGLAGVLTVASGPGAGQLLSRVAEG